MAVPLQHTKKELVLSKRKWEFSDAVNMGIIILGTAAVLASPFHFTWSALWVALVLHWMTIHIGISLSFHRNLSHKSLKLTKSLEYLFAYFGLHAAQRDPMWWVSVHRHHHQFTDSDRDPHSPVEGFWFSYVNWAFNHNYLREKCGGLNNVMDLQKQAYYRFLQKTYYLHLVALALLLYLGGGLSHLIWGFGGAHGSGWGVRIAFGHHFTFMVNSVCHTWGNRPWNTSDLSKNNWVVGFVGFGEGWHNNHHAFEFSARLGLEWWQLDVPWYIIKLLEYLGLATHVKVPTELQKSKFSHKNQKLH
ncbi:hypothetical protein MKW94_023672 [Papaver nudicaule]|uniref:Fatty acid desaturase domain-containing protein n=1 Tax=Papaver nudicaule TaxID=74823 RepID=A0AA41S1C2_PAPNU|nr:hypothetical protein [Papaver nudicaule]